MGDVCEEWARDRWEKSEPVEDSAQSVCLHIGVDVLRKLELVDEKDAAAVEIKFAITAEPWQVRLQMSPGTNCVGDAIIFAKSAMSRKRNIRGGNTRTV